MELPKYTESWAFYKDGFVLIESNATQIRLKITNSTIVLPCCDSTYELECPLKEISIFVARCRNVVVNNTYTESYSENDSKLNKEEERQFQKFKNTTDGKVWSFEFSLSFRTIFLIKAIFRLSENSKKMLIFYNKGRFASKSYGIDKLAVDVEPNSLEVKFSAGSESSSASIENFKNKRFVVERTEEQVDCRNSTVEGLKVVKGMQGQHSN